MVRKMSSTIKDSDGNELNQSLENKIHNVELNAVEELGQIKSIVTRIETQINYFSKELIRVESESEKFVTKTRFKPVEMLVYGFAGLIFTGFVIGLINLIINIKI
jgi:F0F1-type ATP synthase alpha subunit